MLRRVAALLTAAVRASDTVSRLGGEEFMVLCPDTTRAGAHALAEKLRERLASAAFEVDGHVLHVTASFGVSVLPVEEGRDPIQGYGEADKALYRAKSGGRDRVEEAP